MIHRPAAWAQPVTIPGVPNMFKVNEFLYRSAQPTWKGMQNLEKFGIRTIINLRWLHSDKDELKGTYLNYKTCRAKAWHIENEDVIWFLRIITNMCNGVCKDNVPFLVHCQHGADRTGCMVAMYRIVVQGWTREEALKELEEGGFGYHSIWQNIPKYLRRVNVDKIKAGIGK